MDGMRPGRIALVGASRVGSAPPAGGGVAVPAGLLQVELLIAGVPVLDLAPGTRLALGDGVVVELGRPGTPGPEGLGEPGVAGRVSGRVLMGGWVRVGDPVVVDAVALAVEDTLDLHAFRPGDIPAVVVSYLAEALAAGLGEVRLIHGRGRGVQRAVVHRVLGASPSVVGFADAPAERGGWGATVVRLAVPGARPPPPESP